MTGGVTNRGRARSEIQSSLNACFRLNVPFDTRGSNSAGCSCELPARDRKYWTAVGWKPASCDFKPIHVSQPPIRPSGHYASPPLDSHHPSEGWSHTRRSATQSAERQATALYFTPLHSTPRLHTTRPRHIFLRRHHYDVCRLPVAYTSPRSGCPVLIAAMHRRRRSTAELDR